MNNQNINNNQAGLKFRPGRPKIRQSLASALEQIEPKHIIFPIIILAFAHLAALMAFLYQLGLAWCKYT